MARHVNASTNETTYEALMEVTPASVANAYAEWLERATTLSDETFRFAQERLAKDFDAATQLWNCNDTSEAFFLQLDFANKLAADYLEHGGRMLELMTAGAAKAQRQQH